jgi:uncharacterized protein YukE
MTFIDLKPEDIGDFIKELEQSTFQMNSAIARIDKAVEIIQTKWNGDSQKMFIKFYDGWRKGVDVISESLNKMLIVLRSMEETYREMK